MPQLIPHALPPLADPTTHFRVLATADWQIGMVGGAYRTEAATLLRAKRIETIGVVLDVAERAGARAILAAGDLFEFPDQPRETTAAIAKLLNKHRHVPVHAIPGNHDLHGPGTVWTQPELLAVQHLKIHAADGPVELNAGNAQTDNAQTDNAQTDNAQTPVTLWPLPVHSKYDSNEQQRRLEDVRATAGVHIVMAHGHDTSYLQFDHEECVLPINSTAVIEKGYTLLVLGHWHSFHQINSRTVYPGTHEQTKFGERDAGNVAIIDVPLDGSEPIFHKVRVGQFGWHSETIDCTGLVLPDALEQRGREVSVDADFVSLTLTGEVGLNDALHALPRARTAIAEMVEQLTWNDQCRERIDLDAAVAEYELPQGLRQVQEALLQELIDADQTEAAGLRAELEVLYEVAGNVGALTRSGASGATP